MEQILQGWNRTTLKVSQDCFSYNFGRGHENSSSSSKTAIKKFVSFVVHLTASCQLKLASLDRELRKR
jgi:hypothetical protein